MTDDLTPPHWDELPEGCVPSMTTTPTAELIERLRAFAERRSC